MIDSGQYSIAFGAEGPVYIQGEARSIVFDASAYREIQLRVDLCAATCIHAERRQYGFWTRWAG